MANTINDFILWYNDKFKQTDTYRRMQQTVEGSPYHREHSVAVHTDMVVMNYIHISGTQWSIHAALAAAFHDVGKPLAQREKWSEERDYYKSFTGHEVASARIWENWIMTNRNNTPFELSDWDIFTIGYMIEHHKPWGIKDQQKLKYMALTLMKCNADVQFSHLCLADTKGRVADDAAQKHDSVRVWCDELANRCMGLLGHFVFAPQALRGKPILYVLIGASGSGKSTYCNTHLGHVQNVFSYDALRLELYGSDYDAAYLASTKDPHFRSIGNDKFRDLLRQNKDVILDNTNTTRKSRNYFMAEARNRGYAVVAVTFPIAVDVLLKRQHSRGDKNVPADSVRQQYYRISQPQFGEFDDIVIVPSAE